MEYRQGDNIKNTDKCKPGYKYNTRLKSCIPNAAYVDAGGNVRLSNLSATTMASKNRSLLKRLRTTTDPESKRRTAREKGNARTAYQEAARSASQHPSPVVIDVSVFILLVGQGLDDFVMRLVFNDFGSLWFNVLREAQARDLGNHFQKFFIS